MAGEQTEPRSRGLRSKAVIWAASSYSSIYTTLLLYDLAMGKKPGEWYLKAAMPIAVYLGHGLYKKFFSAYDDWASASGSRKQAGRNEPAYTDADVLRASPPR